MRGECLAVYSGLIAGRTSEKPEEAAMKFHFSPAAKATTNYIECDRTDQAPCGTKRRPNASGLCLTSIREAVTCAKCRADLDA
ncbi:hypothetical protein PBI_FLOOF_60 [Microbacterium phage Floof]|uniref:Uncharacterized protein n=1 Tax=Microbacterium phage Floof TaxID=2201433 RepID=A0A2Z4Q4I4_9CAUD|nr:hypothetical protein PBI_FLOOF_60 [Microbacterium phage Floof]